MSGSSWNTVPGFLPSGITPAQNPFGTNQQYANPPPQPMQVQYGAQGGQQGATGVAPALQPQAAGLPSLAAGQAALQQQVNAALQQMLQQGAQQPLQPAPQQPAAVGGQQAQISMADLQQAIRQALAQPAAPVGQATSNIVPGQVVRMPQGPRPMHFAAQDWVEYPTDDDKGKITMPRYFLGAGGSEEMGFEMPSKVRPEYHPDNIDKLLFHDFEVCGIAVPDGHAAPVRHTVQPGGYVAGEVPFNVVDRMRVQTFNMFQRNPRYTLGK